MSPEKSFVGKVEQNVDDLGKVRKRKPWLFYLLLAGFVIFGVLYVFEKFWGIPKLKEQLQAQEKQISELTRDRDSKAAQLAPFLAVANKEFRDAPENKRLELLMQRVEDAARSLETTAKNLNAPRRLTQEQVSVIVAGLQRFTNYSCTVTTMNTDYELTRYAEQIVELFKSASWKVEFQPALLPVSIQGLLVESGVPISDDLGKSLLPLWTSFGHKPTGQIRPELGPRSLTIIVGQK